MTKLYFILICLFGFNNLHAERGFNGYRDDLPEEIQPAWDSTFRYYVQRGNVSTMGTAVAYKVKGDVVYFATAYHNLTSFCPNKGFCSQGVKLLKNHNIRTDGTPVPLNGAMSVHRPYVVKVDKKADLALLGVRDPVLAKKIKPVPFTNTCKRSGERLYVIGYPNLGARSSGRYRNLIDKKVWSTGVSTETLDGIGTTTSVDVIQGNSGGPFVNKDGKLVGVVFGLVGNNNGERYSGRSHSIFTGCERAVKFFTGQAAQRSNHGLDPIPQEIQVEDLHASTYDDEESYQEEYRESRPQYRAPANEEYDVWEDVRRNTLGPAWGWY